MLLKNKVALITGAAQGIGAAIAGCFVKEGARVCVIDVNPDELNRAGQKFGEDFLAVKADITKKKEIQDAISLTLEKFGKIDILVNNAGIIRDGLAVNISEKDWDAVIDVNLKGAFFCCQEVFPQMKKNKGKIVNIASRAWLGNIGQSNYSASKGGLVSLTRTLALEWARYQINVNAVAPGLIDTPMTSALSKEVRERLIRMQPMGKMGTSEDIAFAVAFLASPRADFITGQVLHVDGGKSCGLLSL